VLGWQMLERAKEASRSRVERGIWEFEDVLIVMVLQWMGTG